MIVSSFNYSVTYDRVSFPFKVEYVCISHTFFIHSPVSGHLVGFCLLSVVNNAAINMRYFANGGIVLMLIIPRFPENEFQELRAGQTNHQKIGCRMPFRVQEMKNGDSGLVASFHNCH